MRLGTVEVSFGYVVDLDNEEMVDHAKESVMDDLQSAWRNGIVVNTNPDKDDSLSENDIPDFLRDDIMHRNYYRCTECKCEWDDVDCYDTEDQCECGEQVSPHKSISVEQEKIEEAQAHEALLRQ